MKQTRIPVILIVIFFVFIFIGADSGRGLNMLERGKTSFKKGQFREAVLNFREIILDPQLELYHADAYFWITKSYLAIKEYDKAEKNLEYYLIHYENHPSYPEAYYQKGRLLYLQKEYQYAVQVLHNFIENFKDNPFLANAYYWIGESLYALGHFEKAETVFTHVIQTYPASFKVEAAKYRISIIKLKYREQELLKFLKWSHEEALKAIEEFQIREKTYEQALSAYQKKLTEYAESGVEAKIEELKIDVNEKKAEIESLNDTIASLKGKIGSLNNQLEKKNERLEQVQDDETDTGAVSASKHKEIENLRRLLKLKEEALKLEEFFIEWLRNKGGEK